MMDVDQCRDVGRRGRLSGKLNGLIKLKISC